MKKNKRHYDKYKKFDVVYADFGRANLFEFAADTPLSAEFFLPQNKIGTDLLSPDNYSEIRAAL